MEGLVRLVAESLERHGMTVPPPRVDWSLWVPVDPNLCLTAPCHPGLFVIAEHLVSHQVPRSVSANPTVRLEILKVGQTKESTLAAASSASLLSTMTPSASPPALPCSNGSRTVSKPPPPTAFSPSIWRPSKLLAEPEAKPSPYWPTRCTSQNQATQRPCHRFLIGTDKEA